MVHDTAFLIRPAADADMPTVKALFRAYADALGVDLSFQGLEAELATLPGPYAPSRGALLLAVSADNAALGCVGVRPLGDAGVCEMKRLYARPTVRGAGIGRALAMAAVEAGRRAGYASICLDTLPIMTAAQTLYRSLGFTTTDAYYDTPIAGTVFMRKTLRPAASPRDE